MMASASSFTSIIPQAKYDVLLSFRGEDTRHGFTSHLYAALRRKNIETFIDDELIRGDEISPSLSDAIEGSKVSVIIFSEGYASSRWCLNELVKILQCKDKYGQIVIPVFYHVDPSDVRNQTGNFRDAILKLDERFKGNLDQLQRWRIALREAANLSAFDSHVIRPESVLVEQIVTNILSRLNDMFPSDNKDLVGVDSVIKILESLLSVGSKGVRTLGIWGIGGIGKTTIASAIFDAISCHFDGSYFVQNVREESEKTGRLATLRQELISAILDDGKVSLGKYNLHLNFTRQRLSRKKVLIVFDDVTQAEQVDFLIRGLYKFMVGSRIIVTTRDKQVLATCRVDEIYEVKELLDDYAIKLFSRYAFGQDHPKLGYKKLSNKVIKYAQGVPLVLKVLGCFLYGRRKEDWESAIKKLKKGPHMDIQKVLKVSYDGLDDEEQNIFLDIACFFKGEDKGLVINFLNSCGYSAEIGISVLVDKSLIIVSNNKIMMHDLLQQMGREIVRQESIKDPGKRSRIWHHKDILQVLTKNTGTEAIEGISLDMSKIKDIYLNPHTFTKMPKLRYLKLYSSFYGQNENKVHHIRGLESVFTVLRYLHWHGCPLKSLPLNIHMENLVSIEMPHSNVEELWNGAQHLCNLKYINLSHSKQLTKIPILSLAPNLETLNLEGCTSLLDTDLSIHNLKKLVILNLKQCRSLKSLPTSIHLESLKELFILCLKNLGRLSFQSFKPHGQSDRLLPNLFYLHHLTYLNLMDCGISELPESLGQLSSLQGLSLDNNNFERIPESFGLFSKLSWFSLNCCKRLRSLIEFKCDLSDVIAQCCTSLDLLSGLSIPFTPKSKNLQVVSLINCFKLDLRALGELIEDALLKIQHKATAWPKKYDEESCVIPWGCICFPGNGIPECFSFQSMGSSIELPPGCFNKSFVGFALGAVVAFRDHLDGLRFRVVCDCKLKTEDDLELVSQGSMLVWGDGYVGSDHVCLGHDFQMYSDRFGECYHNNKIFIEFYLEDIHDELIDYCEVTKCGIHLLYSQDFKESMKDHRGSFISDMEDEPHPKRLKSIRRPS